MKEIKLINFDCHKDDDGDLVVAEGNTNNVPFTIARIFNVRVDKGITRGCHAHRECTQLLICTNGIVNVTCDDGQETSIYIMDKPNLGLLIEPGIWSEQIYLKNNTVLTVLCDSPYNEADYIRNYKDFLKFKGDK
jgi:dTDP-4-dehydrorhamnose 3,5-epimerase-like enzyme